MKKAEKDKADAMKVSARRLRRRRHMSISPLDSYEIADAIIFHAVRTDRAIESGDEATAVHSARYVASFAIQLLRRAKKSFAAHNEVGALRRRAECGNCTAPRHGGPCQSEDFPVAQATRGPCTEHERDLCRPGIYRCRRRRAAGGVENAYVRL